jgi:peptidoglycan/LPS O-acetylase OafA/YrhL
MQRPVQPLESEVVSASTSDRIYLPQIDGLRFFAFFLVLIHHYRTPAGYFSEELWVGSAIGAVNRYGWVGVDLFLVLSSFLIFTLLREEGARYGTISLRGFYVRRALRIWPLYFFYLFLALVLIPSRYPFNDTALALKQHLLPFATFTGNISYIVFPGTLSPLFSHLWTISLEEQFYLVAPILIFFSAAFIHRALVLAAVAIAVSVTFRMYATANELPWAFSWVSFLCRLDPFVVGAICALLVRRKPAWLVATPSWLLLMAGALILWSTFSLITPAVFRGSVRFTLVAISAGCFTLAAVALGSFKQFLALKPLRELGKVSFGLYVYHPACIWAVSFFMPSIFQSPTPLAWLMGFAAVFAATTTLAFTSYYLLERPFLRLKARFERVKSRAA